MTLLHSPLQITLYQDVLCSWCYLTDVRLEPLRQEFRQAVRWRVRPFPLRLLDRPPSDQERGELASETYRARREPEPLAARLTAELWLSSDAPHSSVPALVALEAARFQGAAARAQLARAMQRAALEQAVNITRTDVIFELASQVGLAMNAFSTAFHSPDTHQRVLDEHRAASARGVRGVPTLVIGKRWMICGLREVAEYREHILACIGKAPVPLKGAVETLRVVH